MMNKPSLASTLMCGLIARSLASNDRFTVDRRSNCVFCSRRGLGCFFLLPFILPSLFQEVCCHPSSSLSVSLSLTRPPSFSSSAITHQVEREKGRGIVSGQLALCRSDSLQIGRLRRRRQRGKKGKRGKNPCGLNGRDEMGREERYCPCS